MNDKSYSLDTMPQEYPASYMSDFRSPAYEVQREDGCLAGEFLFEKYEILKGKPALCGLPATYVEEEAEAQTLLIYGKDGISGLDVVLSYTVFTRLDAIARSVCFSNHSGKTVTLNRAFSASIDFPAGTYDLLTLPGAWARERHVERKPVRAGYSSNWKPKGGQQPSAESLYRSNGIGCDRGLWKCLWV